MDSSQTEQAVKHIEEFVNVISHASEKLMPFGATYGIGEEPDEVSSIAGILVNIANSISRIDTSLNRIADDLEYNLQYMHTDT